MRNRLHILWRHYSSWLLYAIIAVGGLQQADIQLLDLPKWATTALAFCALFAKLVPQPPKAPPQTTSDPSYGESVMADAIETEPAK